MGRAYYWIKPKWFPHIERISKSERGIGTFFTSCRQEPNSWHCFCMLWNWNNHEAFRHCEGQSLSSRMVDLILEELMCHQRDRCRLPMRVQTDCDTSTSSRCASWRYLNNTPIEKSELYIYHRRCPKCVWNEGAKCLRVRGITSEWSRYIARSIATYGYWNAHILKPWWFSLIGRSGEAPKRPNLPMTKNVGGAIKTIQSYELNKVKSQNFRGCKIWNQFFSTVRQ